MTATAPASRPRALASFIPTIDGRNVVIVVTVGIVAYLTLLPLLFLVWGSLVGGSPDTAQTLTLANYAEAYGSAKTWVMLRDSFVFAIGTAAISLFVGTGLAWIVERTNTPGRNLLYAIGLMPLIVPGILHTISWLLLLSPKIGLINIVLRALLGLETGLGGPINVYSMPGMIWVEGLHLSSLAFLMMTGSFKNMDPSLEEAAATSGASVPRTLYAVSLRLMLPALLSVFLISFVRGLEAFEVPALIGAHADIFVFTWQIYHAVRQYPQNYSLAAAYGMILVVVTVVTLVFYTRATTRAERFAVITGKGFRSRALDIGPYRWVTFGIAMLYVFFAAVLPLFVLIWGSLHAYYVPPTLENLKSATLDQYSTILHSNIVQRAAVNSLFLAILASTLTMLLTSLVAWIITRTKLPGRRLLDFMAFLPIAVPGIVVGTSLLWFYLTVPIPVYATLWILIIAYVTKYMPYGIRTTSSSMVQIHRELEEAAQMSGASWFQTFRRIVLPLLMPAFVSGWIYVTIISARELSSSILLYSSNSVVLSVAIYDLWENGQYTTLCALAVVMVLVLVGLALLFRRLGGQLRH